MTTMATFATVGFLGVDARRLAEIGSIAAAQAILRLLCCVRSYGVKGGSPFLAKIGFVSFGAVRAGAGGRPNVAR